MNVLVTGVGKPSRVISSFQSRCSPSTERSESDRTSGILQPGSDQVLAAIVSRFDQQNIVGDVGFHGQTERDQAFSTNDLSRAQSCSTTTTFDLELVLSCRSSGWHPGVVSGAVQRVASGQSLSSRFVRSASGTRSLADYPPSRNPDVFAINSRTCVSSPRLGWADQRSKRDLLGSETGPGCLVC